MDAILTGLSDAIIVALTLFGESRGEGPDGQIAIANVIRNRVACQREHFGATAREVCLRPQQFSCWNEGDPNRLLLLDTATVMQTGALGPLLRQCVWIAHGLEAGEFVDNTHGATHYVTAALLATHPPAWAVGQKPLITIGSHVFFRVP